jgi:hypothetical protein
MKKFLAVSCLFLSSLAYADGEVKLTAGGSVTLSGMKVSCEGGSSQANLPICQVLQEGTGYSVYVGSQKIEGPVTYGSAMGTRTVMVSSGQCK